MNEDEISKIVTGVTNDFISNSSTAYNAPNDFDIEIEAFDIDADTDLNEDILNMISSEFPVIYLVNNDGTLGLYKVVDGKFVLDHTVSKDVIENFALATTKDMIMRDYLDAYTKHLAAGGYNIGEANRLASEVTRNMVFNSNPSSYVPTFANGEINPSLAAANYDLSGVSTGNLGTTIANMAQSYIGSGLKYVWGGESLVTGADCSGFVQQLYKKCGINIPHYSGSQYNVCSKVSLAQARPGDIAFYGAGGSKHVAIYIGNGKVCGIGGPAGVNIQNYNYRGDFAGFGRVGA